MRYGYHINLKRFLNEAPNEIPELYFDNIKDNNIKEEENDVENNDMEEEENNNIEEEEEVEYR